MTEFELGHPCAGKDCKDCETCIFDEDLFLDKVQPNIKYKMSSNLCNLCGNLEKSYEHRVDGHFDAACRAVRYEALNTSRARRIDYNLASTQDIVRPSWCPLNPNNKHLSLPAPTQVQSPKEDIEELKKKPIEDLTYTERRTLMKELPKHLEWKDIKEGSMYVIPKIMSQSRKIVKVINKTEAVCVCHEISEYTGNECAYSCNIYPSDLDAVFMTELRNF